MKKALVLGAVLAAASVPATAVAQSTDAPPPAAAVDTIAIGRQATEYLYAGRIDSLWAMFTPQFQENLESIEKMWQRYEFLDERAGAEVELIEETVKMRKERPHYWRVAEFEMAPEPLLLRWVISPDGKVQGMGLGLASQAPPTDGGE